MKLYKRILCAFLSLLIVIGMAEMACVSAFADETNPYWIKAGADIKGSLNVINAGKLVQNNAELNNEQVTISASGKTLSISGKTTLPLLPQKTGYVPVFVTSFRNIETGATAGPYIAMMPVESTDKSGKKVYSFSGEYDFSAVSDGKYKMYLWRGYKEENRYYYQMGTSLNAGILHYANNIEVSGGSVKVLKYNTIASANSDAYSKINKYSTSDFLDASLADFVFANKNPKDLSDKGAPLTKEQQNYILSVAQKITKNSSSDYEKIKSIYEYVAANFYYDDKRPSNVGQNSANSNPYENIKGFESKTSNSYNITGGKVATNCVGYTAMVVSLSRALGIPARIVEGVHNTDLPWDKYGNYNNENHHWAECYVNGRWIMIDANMGSQNHYNGSTWTYSGLSNYTFFDPTADEIASNYIVKAVYRQESFVVTELATPKAAYTVNSDRTLTVSWGKVTNADKYEIYSYNASTGTYKYVKTTSDLSYTTGKAAFGTTYKYKIRAVNSEYNIKSGYCTVSAVNNKYLPAPAGKYAVNSDRTLTISWAKVTGADQYEIYSYNASTGTYKYVKTTTALSYQTGKAAFGTTYKYKIRAVNSANNVKSGYCTISAVNNQYLPATTAKFAVNSDCTLTISWAKVTGADKYEIYSYNASTGTYKYVKTTTELSYKTGRASYGVSYKYKIRAVNSANNIKSGYCTVSAVNNKKLIAPTAKLAVNTNGTFTISWGKVTGATKYEVYIFDSKLNDYRLSRTSTGTSITTGTASKGVTYKYKVRAITSENTSATSDFSAVVTGKR